MTQRPYAGANPMTRRNFFRSALACFGAMVLAPVRAVGQPPKLLPAPRWANCSVATTFADFEDFVFVAHRFKTATGLSPKIEFPPV